MLERAEVDGSSWSAETDGRWYLSRFSPLLGVLYRFLELTICHHGHETVLQRVDSRLLNHKGRIVHYPMCTDCRLIGSFLFLIYQFSYVVIFAVLFVWILLRPHSNQIKQVWNDWDEYLKPMNYWKLSISGSCFLCCTIGKIRMQKWESLLLFWIRTVWAHRAA